MTMSVLYPFGRHSEMRRRYGENKLEEHEHLVGPQHYGYDGNNEDMRDIVSTAAVVAAAAR